MPTNRDVMVSELNLDFELFTFTNNLLKFCQIAQLDEWLIFQMSIWYHGIS